MRVFVVRNLSAKDKRKIFFSFYINALVIYAHIGLNAKQRTANVAIEKSQRPSLIMKPIPPIAVRTIAAMVAMPETPRQIVFHVSMSLVLYITKI